MLQAPTGDSSINSKVETPEVREVIERLTFCWCPDCTISTFEPLLALLALAMRYMYDGSERSWASKGRQAGVAYVATLFRAHL